MPRIYLSPSTQDWNPYVDGSGSEEYWMNLLADTLEPYLYANTISFVRNTPEMTAASSIAQANSLGGFDFYLALHSNASGEGQAGKNRGIIVFYYPTSSDGKRAAELFAAQLRMVYPLPAKVTTQATTTLGEVRRPRYPANLIELGYHDNYDDARWIENNLDAAAQAIIPGTPAGERDFDTEFLDYILAVAVVDDLDAAIAHVQHHSTHHSDCIVTENQAAADRFVDEVDSAAVYVNVSTRFTDGGEFGLGCEMGISTQKLHARGPMGLDELSTYKYVITGSGQIR